MNILASVQEAVANAIKLGDAQQVQVELHYSRKT